MNQMLIFFLIFLSFILFNSCGVKGKPQPPINPAVLGRGEIEVKNEDPKKKSKDNIQLQESDWDDPSDFSESQSQ